jgi:hypothetical protein
MSGGSVAAIAATQPALIWARSLRSRLILARRSSSRVRLRVGIARQRLPPGGPVSAVTTGARAGRSVGAPSAGNNRLPAGSVVYRCPSGAVKSIVPSVSCCSDHPPGPQ